VFEAPPVPDERVERGEQPNPPRRIAGVGGALGRVALGRATGKIEGVEKENEEVK
jgi:hypothetical protein